MGDREERAALETRLQEAGVMDTAALPIGATLRPFDLDATMRAPASRPPAARSLPRLSVDLRGSLDGSRGDVAATDGSGRQGGGSDLEVVGMLGEGGMGRVLLARQHSLSRDVAVKTAKDSGSAAAAQAILAEGAVAGRLEHPAIVPVHALGIDLARRPAIVMKRIEGVSWGELAADPAHPGWEGWDGRPEDRLPGHLQILQMICNAVRYAHSRGVVHRDIKLENVLIGRFGDVYLADWGVAAQVGEKSARLCGTPGYMAPEMVDGRPVDERTDVYLLGATLHEALTGELRHPSEHVVAALLSAKESRPYDYGASVPPELAEILNRACHASSEERFEDAGALREAIQRFVSHREAAALASVGIDRVDRAEAMIEEGATSEESLRELERVIAEARFGLEQALEAWPDNREAIDARARLEALLEARRARSVALEREARERDPAIAARARAWALTLFGLVAVLISTTAVFYTGQPEGWELVFYASVVWAVVAAGTVVQRKDILATSFNRNMIWMLHALIAIMVVNRIMTIALELPLAGAFVRDAFVFAAGLLVGAITALRWIAWLSAIFLAAAVLCAAFPERSLPIFAVGSAAAVLTAAGFQWRSVIAMRRPQRVGGDQTDE